MVLLPAEVPMAAPYSMDWRERVFKAWQASGGWVRAGFPETGVQLVNDTGFNDTASQQFFTDSAAGRADADAIPVAL
jgi:hypothetical protein